MSDGPEDAREMEYGVTSYHSVESQRQEPFAASPRWLSEPLIAAPGLDAPSVPYFRVLNLSAFK